MSEETEIPDRLREIVALVGLGRWREAATRIDVEIRKAREEERANADRRVAEERAEWCKEFDLPEGTSPSAGRELRSEFVRRVTDAVVSAERAKVNAEWRSLLGLPPGSDATEYTFGEVAQRAVDEAVRKATEARDAEWSRALWAADMHGADTPDKAHDIYAAGKEVERQTTEEAVRKARVEAIRACAELCNDPKDAAYLRERADHAELAAPSPSPTPEPAKGPAETMPECPVTMYFTVDNYGCGASSVPMADHVEYVRADVVDRWVAEAGGGAQTRTREVLEASPDESLVNAARRVVAERDTALARVQELEKMMTALTVLREDLETVLRFVSKVSCSDHVADAADRIKDAIARIEREQAAWTK